MLEYQEPILLAVVAISLTSLTYAYWCSRRRNEGQRLPPIRRADVLVAMQAGLVTVQSGDLVTSLIIRMCPPRTQSRLKATSRAWRDAVGDESPAFFFSRQELSILAFATDLEVETLLRARELTLPPRGVIGFLSAEEGKGLGVLIRFNQALTSLFLSHNMLGDAGVGYLAAALQGNTTLQSLTLDSNEVGDEGGVALMKSLAGNQSLTFLSLRENGVGPEVHFRHEGETAGIGDETAKALAEVLTVNTSLREIRLGSCEVGDEGAHALAVVLQKRGGLPKKAQPALALTELDLRQNQLTEAAKDELRVATLGLWPPSSTGGSRTAAEQQQQHRFLLRV